MERFLMADFVAFDGVSAEVPGDPGGRVGAGPFRYWLGSLEVGLEDVSGVSARVKSPVAPLVAEGVPGSPALAVLADLFDARGHIAVSIHLRGRIVFMGPQCLGWGARGTPMLS